MGTKKKLITAIDLLERVYSDYGIRQEMGDNWCREVALLFEKVAEKSTRDAHDCKERE